MNSKEIKNSELPIFDRFVGKISDTVIKILKQKLQISQDKINVESTKNSYGVTGKGRGALKISVVVFCIYQRSSSLYLPLQHIPDSCLI